MKYEFQELNWGEKVFLVSEGIKNAPCSQALMVGAPGGRGGRTQDSLFPLDSAFYPNLSCTPALEASIVTRLIMVTPGVFIHGRGSTKPSRSRNGTL